MTESQSEGGREGGREGEREGESVGLCFPHKRTHIFRAYLGSVKDSHGSRQILGGFSHAVSASAVLGLKLVLRVGKGGGTRGQRARIYNSRCAYRSRTMRSTCKRTQSRDTRARMRARTRTHTTQGVAGKRSRARARTHIRTHTHTHTHIHTHTTTHIHAGARLAGRYPRRARCGPGPPLSGWQS